MDLVTIGAGALTVEDVAAAAGGAGVALAPGTRDRLAAARDVVDRALAAGDPVYGLTTQVGHGQDQRLTDEEVRQEQAFLVMSHAGGIGSPLPTELVRAALAVRLAGIAQGGSGAAVDVADTLAAMLNAGVHPVVPLTGSVGAGDLGQMAFIAQVAVGAGRAELDGEVLPGGEALRRAGIAPLVLGGKDGLALISANAVSVGQAALVVTRAERTVAAADVAAALSMEAVGANPSILDPAVGRAKGIRGQVEAADHVRGLLRGSHLLEPEADHAVQDPLSFRVVPQVHGAAREYVRFTRAAVETEVNAAADNPLVSVSDGTLVSNGNFHPMALAIAVDALRVALAHVGRISERRTEQLWAVFFRTVTGPPQGPLAGLALRYCGAALVSELVQLAAPATLDVPPLDLGVEDHGTGAPLAVRKADRALDLLEDLLAVELLMAHDVLSVRSGLPPLGDGTAAVLRTVEEALAIPDPSPDAVHAALRARFPAGR